VVSGFVTYRLNLWCDGKLVSTELLDSPFPEAKAFAITALGSRGADRADLVNAANSVVFQRFAVL
jgi:hypothetical protein